MTVFVYSVPRFVLLCQGGGGAGCTHQVDPPPTRRVESTLVFSTILLKVHPLSSCWFQIGLNLCTHPYSEVEVTGVYTNNFEQSLSTRQVKAVQVDHIRLTLS